MADFKETCCEFLNVDNYATFCSSESKWINKIIKLKEQYPDSVDIVKYPKDNCGFILAHIPKSFFKISPPRQVNYTDEQREQIAARLQSSRNVKNL